MISLGGGMGVSRTVSATLQACSQAQVEMCEKRDKNTPVTADTETKLAQFRLQIAAPEK